MGDSATSPETPLHKQSSSTAFGLLSPQTPSPIAAYSACSSTDSSTISCSDDGFEEDREWEGDGVLERRSADNISRPSYSPITPPSRRSPGPPKSLGLRGSHGFPMSLEDDAQLAAEFSSPSVRRSTRLQNKPKTHSKQFTLNQFP